MIISIGKYEITGINKFLIADIKYELCDDLLRVRSLPGRVNINLIKRI